MYVEFVHPSASDSHRDELYQPCVVVQVEQSVCYVCLFLCLYVWTLTFELYNLWRIWYLSC